MNIIIIVAVIAFVALLLVLPEGLLCVLTTSRQPYLR